MSLCSLFDIFRRTRNTNVLGFAATPGGASYKGRSGGDSSSKENAIPGMPRPKTNQVSSSTGESPKVCDRLSLNRTSFDLLRAMFHSVAGLTSPSHCPKWKTGTMCVELFLSRDLSATLDLISHQPKICHPKEDDGEEQRGRCRRDAQEHVRLRRQQGARHREDQQNALHGRYQQSGSEEVGSALQLSFVGVGLCEAGVFEMRFAWRGEAVATATAPGMLRFTYFVPGVWSLFSFVQTQTIVF